MKLYIMLSISIKPAVLREKISLLKLFSLLTKLQGGLHLQISSLVGYFNKKNIFLVK